MNTKEKQIKKIKEILSYSPEILTYYYNSLSPSFKSPSTIFSYLMYIKVFLSYLCERNFFHDTYENISIEHLKEINLNTIEAYIQNWKDSKDIGPNSIATFISALNSFYKFLSRYGIVDITANIPRPKIAKKPIYILSNCDLANMYTALENSHHANSIRNYAIVSLLHSTGIRVSELVNLNIDDVDFYAGTINVIRKGGNLSSIPLDQDAVQALITYFRYRTQKPIEDKALFLSTRNKRLSVKSIQNLLKKFNVTPHMLRKKAADDIYKDSRDIYLAAALLDHANVTTTQQHYVPPNESALIEWQKNRIRHLTN